MPARTLPLSPRRAHPDRRSSTRLQAVLGLVRTSDPDYARLLGEIRRYAATDLSLLLCGESGTGKELIARGVHDLSPRASGPFVTLNCAALSEALMESELFGHVRGAFTGAASTRPGALLSASGGTLFLDELGEAPLCLQVALLRCLESQKVRAVGSDREVPIDVRLVTATSRPLDALMQSGAFREDLYHRLAGARVHLPPLRERLGDLPALTAELLDELGFAGQMHPHVLSLLSERSFPGNIRQLKNTLQRALAHLPGGSKSVPSFLLPDHFETSAPSQISSVFSEVPPQVAETHSSRQRSDAGLVPIDLAPGLRYLNERAQAFAESEWVLVPKGTSRRAALALERAYIVLLSAEAEAGARGLSPFLQARVRRLFHQHWRRSDGGRGERGLQALFR